jgi:hypothetical protein
VAIPARRYQLVQRGAEFVERGFQPLEPSAEIRGFAANPEAKMLRRLEEFTRHNRGFVFLAQEFEKNLRIAAPQPRENN